MSESKNSEISELTKNAYNSVIALNYAETDLVNTKTNLESGKMFRAMENLDEGIKHLSLGIEAYKKLMQELKSKELI